MPTDQVIEEFVHEWFDLLSAHAPVDQLLPFVTDDGLEMQFPERTLHSQDDFRDWYTAVGTTYVDQSHDVEKIVATPSGPGTNLDVTVVWKAEQIADGVRIATRVQQSWRLDGAPGGGRPQIERYHVLALRDL